MDKLTNNRFAMVGRSYLSALSELVKSNEKDKRTLFNTLTQLRLSNKNSLGLHLPVNIGYGDTSWFYVYPKGKDPFEGKSQVDLKFATLDYMNRNNDFDFLQVTPSAMGVWQAYLYSIAPTLLPTIWHGGYISRTYIFSQEVLDNYLKYKCNEELSLEFITLIEEITQPIVKYGKRKAIVSCCYWSDWAGLVRDTISIRFDTKQDKIVSMDNKNREILNQYDYGIRF